MAEIKVLDYDGLDYFAEKIDGIYVKKDGNKKLSTEDYTTDEKNKLMGIQNGAQVNVLEGVKVNGADVTIANKKVNIDLSAYALKSDISTVMRYVGTVATVSALPATANLGDVYNVEENGSNYAWDGSKWDELGASVDLTGYYTKTEVDSAISTAVAPKADKSYVDTELAKKANSSDVYTKTEIDGKVSTINGEIAKKANSADVYTKGQVDTELGKKLNTSDLVAISNTEIDGFFA